jgi:serine phosphatase RsbU (regulator of sigma subunit)
MEELRGQSGPALGMIPNTPYENYEIALENGEMLFFYTDGLSELMDRERVQFGVEELHKAILSNMHLPPHSFTEAIMYAADAFAEGLDNPDDITLLTVSYQS